MDYIQACDLAFNYFEEHLGIKGLAIVTENKNSWFFSAGKDSSGLIGNTIVSVSKSNGFLQLVDMLSDEGFDEVQGSTVIDIPIKFRAK